MEVFLKVLEIVAIVCGSLFVLSWIVYFFNLDMKLTSSIEPFLIEHYDNMPRNSRL